MITTKTETITPEMAAKYLEKNTRNYRNSKPSRVLEFVRLIKSGKFVETHQGIAFDEDGVLGDGQHRLQAIVSAGVSVKAQVTRGMSRDAFLYVDRPLLRNLADQFLHDGVFADGRVKPSRAAGVVKTCIGRFSGRGNQEMIAKKALSFGRVNEDVIVAICLALEPVYPWSAEVAAAFVNAAIGNTESGEAPSEPFASLAVVEASARRFALRKFSGDDGDPLATLERVMAKARSARRSFHNGEVYALSVSAIRADLEGRPLVKLYPSERDWDESPSPRARRIGKTAKPAGSDAAGAPLGGVS